MNQNNRKKWKYGIFIFVLLLLPLLGLVSPFFQNQSQAETLLSGNFGGVSYVFGRDNRTANHQSQYKQ